MSPALFFFFFFELRTYVLPAASCVLDLLLAIEPAPPFPVTATSLLLATARPFFPWRRPATGTPSVSDAALLQALRATLVGSARAWFYGWASISSTTWFFGEVLIRRGGLQVPLCSCSLFWTVCYFTCMRQARCWDKRLRSCLEPLKLIVSY